MSNNGDKFEEKWQLVEVNMAADQLGIRLNTLMVYLAQRKLTAHVIGGRWRIRQQDLDAYIKRREMNRHRAGRKKKVILNRRANPINEVMTQ